MSTFKMCAQPCHTWCAKNNNNNNVLKIVVAEKCEFYWFCQPDWRLKL